jgi:phage terminase large subunit GpA-like protein
MKGLRELQIAVQRPELGCGEPCLQQSGKRRRHQEFIRFLNAVEAQVPRRKTIHAIVDNYATHQRFKVREWLARHPRWTFAAINRGKQALESVTRYSAFVSSLA